MGLFIKENPTRHNNVSKFYYSIFILSSTCFGRHTAHHQESKTALAASGFSYLEGCWTCSWWTLSGKVYCAWQRPPTTLPATLCAWQRPPTTGPTTFHVWKTGGCQCSFRLLMMGGVSPDTCWASYEYEIKKNFDALLYLVGFSLWTSVTSLWEQEILQYFLSLTIAFRDFYSCCVGYLKSTAINP